MPKCWLGKPEQLQRFKDQLEAIDKMTAEIDRHRIEPVFSDTIRKRQAWSPDYTLGDDHVLHRCIDLIAYSNNAKSEIVKPLLASGIFSTIFKEYSVSGSASLNPQQVLQSYWPRIKAIRFKYKIGRMIGCAKCLLALQGRRGSFMDYLKAKNLPLSIRSEQDIDQFWQSFDIIRLDFSALDFPYFKNFTSLCHLLMDIGFDCAKPDLAVMKAAVKLKIVPPAPRQ